MRILVTGGRGAVGRPLTDILRARGHDVWVCDVAHAADPRYLRCDVGEYRELQAVMDQVNPEFVYHLGAEFGRWNGEDYYERLWRTNAVGTKHVLRMQEERRFRMLFTSSSEVYGDWDELMDEDVLDEHPVRQMNDYAITKWVNEQQIMNSADRFGTETVRVRLFNTYGPGEPFSEYRSVICRFVYCALHDLPYTVYLNHRRTSSYVDDTAATLATACEPTHFKAGEVYNIAGDEYRDIKSLSDMILDHVGKTDRLVEYKEVELHNTRNKRTTAEKAAHDLDHRSTVPLEVGIARTIEWQRERYGRA